MFRCHGTFVATLTTILSVLTLCGAVMICGQPSLALAETPEVTLPEGVMPPGAVLQPAPLASAADSTIAAMVGEVSGDSIYASIEQLSGAVPVQFEYGSYTIPSRYTPCQSSRMAAEFLGMCFEAYGYTVDMHYYAIPSLYAILVESPGVSLMAGQWGHVFRTVDVSEWPRARDGIEMVNATIYGCDHVSAYRYAAVGASGAILTSDDAGQSWTERTSGVISKLEDVSILTSGTGWACGSSGVILHTTDGGTSWAAQTSGVSDALLDIVAVNELVAVAVGSAGRVLRTINGGLSWSTVTSGTTSNLNGLCFVGPVGWAAGSAGGIIKSTDGGMTWSTLTSGTTSNLKDVHFADANTGWAVGTTGGIFKTTNGGGAWSSQTGTDASATWRAVYAVSSTEVWIAGLGFDGGLLARTTDGGSSWEDRGSTVKGGTANVVAIKEGASAPAEDVILCGHYDSVPSDCLLAPGADDNGSGIGVILEAARVMAESGFVRTIKFVCFSGEEQGLHGADAYAHRAQTEGEQIIAAFNLDSVGWNDDYFRLFSDNYSGWLGDLGASMAATYAPGLPTYHWNCPTCNWSDHYPFWEHGFEAIVGIETWDPAPPHHHTVGDTMGLLDKNLMANVAKISVATIASVAVVDTTFSGVDIPVADAFSHRMSRPSPNPFSPSTTIEFSVARPGKVKIRVFDTSGRLVKTLVDAAMPAGAQRVSWDGTDESGRTMSPGVYFYRIHVGPLAETAKLILAR